jgi:predicted Zn-dependent peptidase
MKRLTLSNGLEVIYKHLPGKTLTCEVMVKVGSNNEIEGERGISHMIEHLLFEGTRKRPTGRAIANEIEIVGGEFNAYTTSVRTNYHIKLLSKDFKLAMDVLSDVLFHPLFLEKSFLRERSVVLKEIDMLYDNPRYYQWIILQDILFTRHPSKKPVYGDKKQILKLNVGDIQKYYQKHYVPSNMVLSIVGDIPNWKEISKKYFGIIQSNSKKPKAITHKEPYQKRNRKKIEKRPVMNTQVVIGYHTVSRRHKDSYVLDVIDGILGRGQSGRIFTQLREKRGLAYDVGTHHVSDIDFGYFALFCSVDKKNVPIVQKVVKEELKKLLLIDKKDLKEAQKFVEGNFYLNLESTHQLADQILVWEHICGAQTINKYVKNVKSVTINDVKRIVKKYFTYSSTVIIEGK